MPLPNWVYNQSSLPPWMQTPAPPPNPRPAPPSPQGMPGPILGNGNSPGISNPNFLPRTPWNPATSAIPFGTPTYNHNPTPLVSQNNNTNPGMVGMLPPGHAGSNVPAPQMQVPQYRPPTYEPPTFENYSGAPPQFSEPTFEQYSRSPLQYVDPQFENSPTIQNPSTSGLDNQYAQLMAQLQGKMSQPGVQFNPFTPEKQQYSQSSELTNAIEMIRSLAESGGYSEGDKADLRARGVSPIRSVYSNAMQDLDRTRALQGGYSPNHTAATAKLTRELADRIAGQTTNVNADIADKVAQGKMQMAPQLGNITSHVNDLINSISGSNVNASNEAGMFNTTGQFNADVTNQSNQNQLMGMIQQLFGTGADIQGRNADRAVNIAGLNQQSVNSRNQNALARATGQNQFNMQGRELDQQGVESRNRNALDLSNSRNSFNMQGRELDQRAVDSRNQNAATTAASRNQFNMQGSELNQQMQQFLQRMGLDTAQMNQTGNIANQRNMLDYAQLNQAGNRDTQSNELDWARLNQQGGLGLIQALMQLMGQQQGRA